MKLQKIDIPLASGPRGRRLFARAPGYGVDVEAKGDTTEISVFGELGWDVTAASFRDELKKASGDLTVRINSPGGDAATGLGMFNDLVAHPGKVTVEISGIAASAASVVAMAGDEIFVAESSVIMIHRAWALSVGNSEDFAKFSEILSKFDQALAAAYVARTGLPTAQILDLMTEESWFSGQEAVALGFATKVLPGASQSNASATFDLSIYNNVPAHLKRSGAKETTKFESRYDLETQLKKGLNLSRGAAKRIADAGWPVLAEPTIDPAMTTLADKIASATEALRSTRT